MANALKEEARAHRDEVRRREWREKSMYLTREEAAAGQPCRGCGLPVIDNLGDWPGTMSPEERDEYAAVKTRYEETHPDCGSYSWTMAGSRSRHCGFCCPPIPFSDSQLADVARIFMSSKPRDEDLDIWERTLTCGHRMRRPVHHTNSGPDFSTERCEECETTRGVVSSEKVVEAAARKSEAQRKRDEQLDRAELELAKAEQAAKEAHRKLDELRAGSTDE
ncbi:hypothetical protein ACFS27_22990 [Promicromonospora vindobonensis]|uniref:Uncharacterized protein n=1 Tax=Promicromonospora vindobonensis TaxID=195748 RepID=A0ABW5VZK9_9MICO